MARLPRVYLEGILYYVTCRSGHGQKVFFDNQDFSSYLSLVAEYKKQYGFKLFAYVLLPAHLHLIIEVKNGIGVSNIMHDINSRYTKMHNSRYQKKGHLFQARFKALMAEKQPYLLPLIEHVHTNPLRVGLVSEAKDWDYSSFCQLTGQEAIEFFSLADEFALAAEVLAITQDELRSRLLRLPAASPNKFDIAIHKKRILGSLEFVEEIKSAIAKAQIEQAKAQKPRRPFLITVIIILLVTVSGALVTYFYRKTTTLQIKYDQTMRIYEQTLAMLNRQRDLALETNESVEEYVWKIRVAEQALEDYRLEQKQKAKNRSGPVISGYAYRVGLRQIGGPNLEKPIAFDTLVILSGSVASRVLSQEGFNASNYSLKRLSGGRISWDTIQRNKQGQIANWRGEWNGRSMSGVLRRTWTDGVVRDFSFQSVGERVASR